MISFVSLTKQITFPKAVVHFVHKDTDSRRKLFQVYSAVAANALQTRSITNTGGDSSRMMPAVQSICEHRMGEEPSKAQRHITQIYSVYAVALVAL